METSSTPRKKTRSDVKLEKNPVIMKYQYQGQTLVSKFENEVQWIIDTKIEHIELDAIKQEVDHPNLQVPYRRINRSGLVEATIFPQEIQSP